MRILLITTTLAALVLTYLYSDESENHQSGSTVDAVTVTMEAARKKSQDIIETFESRLKPVGGRSEIPTPGSQLEVAFEPWSIVKSSLNKKETRAKIIQSLITKPGLVELSKNVLQDTDFAKETFGQNQALSRIIAIEILLEEARNLNPEPLRETLVSLNQKYSVADPDLGQRQDLEDLLSGYFHIQIPDFPQGLESALHEINFSKNLETIFMVAVLNNGGKRHYDHAMKILKNYSDS